MSDTLPCQGCGAALDCDDQNVFAYTLTGDPTYPYIFMCPQGENCRNGTTISINCCGHVISRTITPGLDDATLTTILNGMFADCQQFQSECSNPPVGPGPGTPVDPIKLYFNSPQTCTVQCP